MERLPGVGSAEKFSQVFPGPVVESAGLGDSFVFAVFVADELDDLFL